MKHVVHKIILKGAIYATNRVIDDGTRSKSKSNWVWIALNGRLSIWQGESSSSVQNGHR